MAMNNLSSIHRSMGQPTIACHSPLLICRSFVACRVGEAHHSSSKGETLISSPHYVATLIDLESKQEGSDTMLKTLVVSASLHMCKIKTSARASTLHNAQDHDHFQKLITFDQLIIL